MYPEDDPRTPLPEWITDAYDVLCTHLESGDSAERHRQQPEIPRERAVALLLETDDVAAEQSDAEYALDRLLQRGYLYQVGDYIRVTTPRE